MSMRSTALSALLAGSATAAQAATDSGPAFASGTTTASLILAVIALLALAVWLGFRAGLRHAAALRRKGEERLKLALWGTGDELWDIDLVGGSVRRENPLPTLAAPPEGAASAVSLRGFVHPEDIDAFDAAFAAHVRGETDTFEATYRARGIDGGWRWVRSRGRVSERDAAGRAVRVTGTNGDVDDLRRGELALQQLNQELEERVARRTADLSQANERLQQSIADLRLAQAQLVESEKMAALGGLVAGVAHEINTPLGVGVTAASHLQAETARIKRLLEAGELKRSELDAYTGIAHESAEIILRNLRRADKLVKSFKQVAVDQGSEAPREIELAQYLDEILTSLRPALKRTRHRIEVSCPPGLRFTTQPGAIYQIVVNLVMNSVIHAFEEGQAGEIRIEVARREGEIVLSYADNGRGMDEEARRRIFEPFFTTRRGQGGSGLGMHIVFNLVTQALNGRIECDSAPGRGVYFSLRIPAALPASGSAGN